MAKPGFTPPPGGTDLLPPGTQQNFFLTNETKFGNKKNITVSGQSFAQAVEIRTAQRPENPWDFQLCQKIHFPIHKGDVLWVSLWMRAIETSAESQEAFSQLSIEQASAPYDKLQIADFSAGRDWQQFAWAFAADRDYANGETQICLRFGYAPQAVQLGNIQILNYGQTAKPGDLPRIAISYPGMEPNAPWRKEAAKRIDRYRKADLDITVNDSSGKPITDATVKIEQLRHAFGFGSCVVAQFINGKDADSEHYREIIKNSYSKVVFENDLKWGQWEQQDNGQHRAATLAALQWLRAQNIRVRGHNLVWPSWKFTPHRLADYKNDPAALEQKIEDHIRDIVSATKGQLSDWDVVNEPYTNHDILDLLPPGIMARWFQLAHEIDPQPVLFLNDYAGFMQRGENTPHKDAFEKTLRELKAQGAPIGGLGIQAHFDNQFTGPEQLLKELDRWAALGLKIEITEFDLNTNDEEIQARYTRDFMTAIFSHPAVDSLLMWGFWEGADWKSQAALYRKDWSLKPNSQAWNDLVLKEWHTSETLTTNANGKVNTRGFLGDYQITITSHGNSKIIPLTLTREGTKLPVVF